MNNTLFIDSSRGIQVLFIHRLSTGKSRLLRGYSQVCAHQKNRAVFARIFNFIQQVFTGIKTFLHESEVFSNLFLWR
jgi:hypothetical protein